MDNLNRNEVGTIINYELNPENVQSLANDQESYSTETSNFVVFK